MKIFLPDLFLNQQTEIMEYTAQKCIVSIDPENSFGNHFAADGNCSAVNPQFFL
jgi:hypothetical protein